MEQSDEAEYMEAWRAVEEATKKCPDHGDYDSTLMAHRHPQCKAFWTKCPECNKIWEQEERETRERYEACVSRDPGLEDRIDRMMLDAAGIPHRYRNAKLSGWKASSPAAEKVGERLREYSQSFDIALERGQNLIFIGNPGTGKTFAACAIMHEVIAKRSHSAVYVTAHNFLTRLRNCYSNSAEEREVDVFDDYVSPSLLVVDEVGRHKDSQHAADSLFALLDRRYQEVRPTIVISNLHKEEIVDYLGEAMVSRLRQGGAMLGFYWEDQRK